MFVAVTGAAGGIGRFVCRELNERGHRVLPLDRAVPPAGQGESRYGLEPPADVTILDLLDAEATAAALAGVDAVIHLAAIPSPVPPPWKTFDTNMATTYHVLEAVREHKIGRVVMASSIWAYGYLPGDSGKRPAVLPLAEPNTVATTNCYGLSKRYLEALGREYHEACGAQVVCMRYPFVASPRAMSRGRVGPCDDADPGAITEAWSYVDVRDVAVACRLAAERDGLGHTVLNIAAADTRSDTPSAELVERYLPGARLSRPVQGYEALYSIERARQQLGYEPQRSWRSQ